MNLFNSTSRLNWWEGPCQGACDEHVGKVQLVEVAEWGQFRYCEAAIEEDGARNFTVYVVEQPKVQMNKSEKAVKAPTNTLEVQASKIIVTKNEAGAIVAVTRQDAEGRIVEVIAEASQPVQPDTTRLDWLAMYGSFGADSSSGRPGGNGQKRMAATRTNIDAAIAQTESTK